MNATTTETVEAAAPGGAESQAAPVAPSQPAQKPHVAAGASKASRKATSRKGAPKATPKPASKAKPARVAKPAKNAAVREGSKTEKLLTLLRRSGGATLKELMKASGWQAHSVRGFLSAAVGKKLGLKVSSTKEKGGERSYSVKA